MKKALVILLLLASAICYGQGRIEIYVNGELQKISTEAIRVKNLTDKIEIRITPSGLRERTTLIDSIQTEGCGILVNRTGGGQYFEPKVQKYQQSSINDEIKKDAVSRVFIPEIKESYLSFSATLNQITACKGKFFYLKLMFDPQKSDVSTYVNYMDKFKLYYVL